MKTKIKKLVKRLLAIYNHVIAKVYSCRIQEEPTDSLIQYFEQLGYKEAPFLQPENGLMETDKDVSFILPVYNCGQFIGYCLDTILSQKTDYTFEVICVNDGSKDNSLDILRGYEAKYPNRMVVIDQPNGGASVARNTGIDHARGEYLAFVDSDEFVYEGYIDKLMNKAKAENADIVQAGFRRVRPDRSVIGSNPRKTLTFEMTDLRKAFENVSGFLWSSVIRKSLFNNLRFPIGYWYEDMMTRSLVMRRAKKVCIIEDCVYGYTCNDRSLTHLTWDSHNIKCLDQVFLAKNFQDYGTRVLGLQDNAWNLSMLLENLSQLTRDRMRWQPEDVKVKAFLMIHNIIKDFTPGIKPLTPLLNDLHQAILSNDYHKWKYLSICRRWLS